FYTGNQQFANNQGRVEQFKSKFARKDEIKANVEKASAEQKAANAKNKK
ncbi:50S ribosomal protein L31, partial [Rhizobium sp. KAs_5_22]